MFFPIPNPTNQEQSVQTPVVQSGVKNESIEQLVPPPSIPPALALASMMMENQPGNSGFGDMTDDWVDIQDMDSDSTIEFASPKNVIVIGSSNSTGGPTTSLLPATSLSLGLNSAGNGIAYQQYFLPISAIALRVFSKLPEFSDLLTSQTCLPLTQSVLRLALGLSDTSPLQPQGSQGSKALNCLPALPFLALDDFLVSQPSYSFANALEAGCVQLLLAAMHCLSRQQDSECVENNPFIKALGLNTVFSNKLAIISEAGDETSTAGSSSQHWAKGTGFGSGPTSVNQSVDVRVLAAKQKQEEQLLTLCYRLLTRFVTLSSQTHVPQVLTENMFSSISKSCFSSILCSYLQNDSIMDVSRHLILYESALDFWTALAEEMLKSGQQMASLEKSQKMDSLLTSFEERLSAYVGTLRVITASSTNATNEDEQISEIPEETTVGAESDLDPVLTAVRKAQKLSAKMVAAGVAEGKFNGNGESNEANAVAVEKEGL